MSRVARINVRRAVAPKRAKRPATPPAPIVKWVGGKTKLVDKLAARQPGRYRRYFEPFLGGGALFFKLRPTDAVLTDRNADLITMYNCVAWNVEAVIRRLYTHRKNHCEEHYYKVRTDWNEGRKKADVDRAAAFIYLNKTCYNGLWRVNKKGGFNVPMGRYESPRLFEPARLRAAAKVLQHAELVSGHYSEGVSEAASGDFVYFDPPYHPLTPTANFTSYTAGSFSEDDQRALADLARRLTDRGCAVMLSNSDTPFIRRLYRGFRIHRVQVSRAINSNASRRGAVGEVIVTSDF